MIMDEEIRFLQKQANELRKDVVKMVYLAKDGHPGPALSIADIIATLYFKVLHIDGKNPNWEKRDRFILSKGHACPVVYSALARRGFFPEEILPTLRAFGSKLQGHPDMKKTPGIDMTSGSLGNGLSIGLGMTLAAKYLGNEYYVYVIMGDGELQEGIVWEAMMAAAKYQAGRLIVFVDHNGLQSGDSVAKVSGLLPILPKFEAFGWHCREIDGHDIGQILAAIESAQNEQERPSLILARTVKGKGVPFMEGDNSWHKRVPTQEQYEEAIAALGGDEDESL
jgi:transketolase